MDYLSHKVNKRKPGKKLCVEEIDDKKYEGDKSNAHSVKENSTEKKLSHPPISLCTDALC